ncbi:MAG: serine/threonine protein kinase, partial [Anaerolineae bacterium]|nr:serine/threonine protein kinase [Anaerolineae bacterium]
MKITIGGRYEFDSQTDIIGRGGMGTVYRGKDTTTNTVIAIKQLRPDLTDTEIIARFIREADILRQLEHPNIIRVVDRISDVELGHYIVMEHITSGSLWDELQATRPLSIGRSITLAQNLASALMLVHEKNIIHRDIKPANVLIADDKSPRLCDFGVVYIKDNTAIAEANVLVGTLDYLAPEIINGDPITPQADIWSFGVMLYEMVGGKKPFTSDNPSTIIANILFQTHHQLAQLRTDAPSGLVKLIEWMLVKDPVKRAPNMSIIHQTLNDISNGGAFNTTISYTHPASLGKKPFKRIGTSPKIFTDNLFYDRNHEQTNVTNAIVDGKSFIGVYGRGGIGKTALVSKVLGDVEKRGEANGIAYIRANSSPSLNIISILDTLGEFLPSDHHFNTLRRDVNTSIADKTHALINGLADGRYIVYIDNLETLQHPENYTLLDDDISQLFETLVETTNGVLTVIITSRYPIPFPNTLKVHETVIRLDEGLPEDDAILFLRDMDRLGVLPTEDDLLTHWVDKVGGYPRGLEALVGYLNGGETRHIDDLLQDEALFEGEILSNIVHHAHNALPQDFRHVMAAVAVIDNATTRSELEYLLSPYLDAGRLRFILERLVDGRFLSYNRQNRTYTLHPIDHAYALSSTPEG